MDGESTPSGLQRGARARATARSAGARPTRRAVSASSTCSPAPPRRSRRPPGNTAPCPPRRPAPTSRPAARPPRRSPPSTTSSMRRPAPPPRARTARGCSSHLRETLRAPPRNAPQTQSGRRARHPAPLSRESGDARASLPGHGGPTRSSREPSALDARAGVPLEDVLTLRYDQPVGEAIRQLASRNVLSAPVIDFAAGVRYKGFLSVGDIVLDLVQRDTAEKHLLLHQLGEAARGYATRRSPSTTSFDHYSYH